MTRLLISVRSAAEATAAVEAGADLIDVKEPGRGALGAAEASTIEEVLHAVRGRRPVSAAFGELRDWQDDDAPKIPPALTYAKFGLAGCADIRGWVALWRRRLNAVPRGVKPVAVAYADRQSARAPDPYEIAEHARDFGCPALLLDTFEKAAGSLLDIWSLVETKRFIDRARTNGLFAVVAGSLTEQTIPSILPLGPDYIAVRGAACSGGRTGHLDPAKVERLAQLLGRHSMTGAPARQDSSARVASTAGQASCGTQSVDSDVTRPSPA